jgi:hypothetical protein
MEIDSGNTAWVLTSAALVLLMTPGPRLFYGGMARSKSVLNMLMMSFSALGIVSVPVGAVRLRHRLRLDNGGLFGFSSGLLGPGRPGHRHGHRADCPTSPSPASS